MAFAVHRVLFPTDFSAASDTAGRTAVTLARQFGAALTILYVVPPLTDPSPGDGIGALAAELAPGMAVKTEVLSGIPARKIDEYARRHRIDLIVMGSHGRTGLSRALLGSVAEAVVRRGPCPVLVVPPTPPSQPETAVAEEMASCVVCAGPSVHFVCEACRTRIRGGESSEAMRKDA